MTVEIGKHKLDALVDTGAISTLMSVEAAKALNLKINPTSSNRPLVSATGSELEIIGHTIVPLYFKGLQVTHTVSIVKQLTAVFLLGSDFLSANSGSIDYTRKPPVFCLFDGLINFQMFSRCDETNSVTVAQTTCFPAYHEAYIRVKTGSKFNNRDAQLEQHSCISCVTVANAFVACKNNETVCRLLNHNPFVIVLKGNENRKNYRLG